jgi:hypothetical protein
LYKLAKSQDLPTDFQRQFLEEILKLGPKTGSFSKDHFKDFLAITKKHEFSSFKGYAAACKANREVVNKSSKQKTDWNHYVNQICKDEYNTVSKIIDKYMEYFCEMNKGSLQEYKENFEESFLKTFENRWKCLCSEDGLESLDRAEISLSYFKKMADEVKLEFAQSNQDHFAVDEQVSLKVIVKNISLLQVKVFEFNTETYYKKNLKPFDSSVNLDGLEAAEANQYNYK